MSFSVRNRHGFILICLCDDFTFNILLSAANDLMTLVPKSSDPLENQVFNDHSSSAVLLGYIVPALCVQILFNILKIENFFTLIKVSRNLFLVYLMIGYSTRSTMIRVCAASRTNAMAQIQGSIPNGGQLEQIHHSCIHSAYVWFFI